MSDQDSEQIQQPQKNNLIQLDDDDIDNDAQNQEYQVNNNNEQGNNTEQTDDNNFYEIKNDSEEQKEKSSNDNEYDSSNNEKLKQQQDSQISSEKKQLYIAKSEDSQQQIKKINQFEQNEKEVKSVKNDNYFISDQSQINNIDSPLQNTNKLSNSANFNLNSPITCEKKKSIFKLAAQLDNSYANESKITQNVTSIGGKKDSVQNESVQLLKNISNNQDYILNNSNLNKENLEKLIRQQQFEYQEKNIPVNEQDKNNVNYLNENKIASAKGQHQDKTKYLGVDQRIYELQPRSYEKEKIIMQCENLKKEFKIVGREDTVVALQNITLSENSEIRPIREGEFVMIRGPSGCGKTTFLNLLGSIDMASSGEIRILGDIINSKSKDEYLSKLRLEKIGFVFQTFNLLATMTAYENVELPMRVHGKLSEKQMKKRVRDLLIRVGLQDRMDHLPSELSGGEQQRVAIARALANSPKVLLLDEPTGDLDTRSTVEIMNLLLSINNFGYSQEDQTPATMVMVTHNPDIEMYANRILYFKDGTVIEQAYNEIQTPIFWEDYIQSNIVVKPPNDEETQKNQNEDQFQNKMGISLNLKRKSTINQPFIQLRRDTLQGMKNSFNYIKQRQSQQLNIQNRNSLDFNYQTVNSRNQQETDQQYLQIAQNKVNTKRRRFSLNISNINEQSSSFQITEQNSKYTLQKSQSQITPQNTNQNTQQFKHFDDKKQAQNCKSLSKSSSSILSSSQQDQDSNQTSKTASPDKKQCLNSEKFLKNKHIPNFQLIDENQSEQDKENLPIQQPEKFQKNIMLNQNYNKIFKNQENQNKNQIISLRRKTLCHNILNDQQQRQQINIKLKEKQRKLTCEWAQHVQFMQKQTEKYWTILRYIFKFYSNTKKIFENNLELAKFKALNKKHLQIIADKSFGYSQYHNLSCEDLSLGVISTICWYLPQNLFEVIFMLLIMLTTSIIIGYSVTTIGNILQSISEKNSKLKKEKQLINRFFVKHKLNLQLRTRIEKYIEYIHELEKDNNQQEDEQVIQRLTGQLKKETILSLNNIDKNKQFKILNQNFSQKLVNELILHIKQLNFGKNEIIQNKNEHQNLSLYLIIKGKVQFFYEREINQKQQQQQYGSIQENEQQNGIYTLNKKNYSENNNNKKYLRQCQKVANLDIKGQNNINEYNNDLQQNSLDYQNKKIKNFIAETHKLDEGETFGEFSFFTGFTNEISIKSIENCTLYYIERKNFLQILSQYPNDLEMFCFIRDQMIEIHNLRQTSNKQLKKNRFDIIKINCQICEKEGHLPEFCPDLHYIPDKQQVIKEQYVRRQFIRKRKKNNALNNFNDHNILIEEEDTVQTSSQNSSNSSQISNEQQITNKQFNNNQNNELEFQNNNQMVQQINSKYRENTQKNIQQYISKKNFGFKEYIQEQLKNNQINEESISQIQSSQKKVISFSNQKEIQTPQKSQQQYESLILKDISNLQSENLDLNQNKNQQSPLEEQEIQEIEHFNNQVLNSIQKINQQQKYDKNENKFSKQSPESQKSRKSQNSGFKLISPQKLNNKKIELEEQNNNNQNKNIINEFQNQQSVKRRQSLDIQNNLHNIYDQNLPNKFQENNYQNISIQNFKDLCFSQQKLKNLGKKTLKINPQMVDNQIENVKNIIECKQQNQDIQSPEKKNRKVFRRHSLNPIISKDQFQFQSKIKNLQKNKHFSLNKHENLNETIVEENFYSINQQSPCKKVDDFSQPSFLSRSSDYLDDFNDIGNKEICKLEQIQENTKIQSRRQSIWSAILENKQDGVYISQNDVQQIMLNLSSKFLSLDSLLLKKAKSYDMMHNKIQKIQLLKQNDQTFTSQSTPKILQNQNQNQKYKLQQNSYTQYLTPYNFNDLGKNKQFNEVMNPIFKKKIEQYNQTEENFQKIMKKMKEQQRIEYQCVYCLFGTDSQGRIPYRILTQVMKQCKKQLQKQSQKIQFDMANSCNININKNQSIVLDFFKFDHQQIVVNSDKKINFQDFFDILMTIMQNIQEFIETVNQNKEEIEKNQYTLSEKEIAEFRFMFSLFDKNGDEKIEIKELQKVMKTSLGAQLSEEDVLNMIHQVGYNTRTSNLEEKVVYFYEFVQMLSQDLKKPELTVNQIQEYRQIFTQMDDYDKEKISLQSLEILLNSEDFPKFNNNQRLFQKNEVNQIIENQKLKNMESIDLDCYLQIVAKKIMFLEKEELKAETYKIFSNNQNTLSFQEMKQKIKVIFGQKYSDHQIQLILNEARNISDNNVYQNQKNKENENQIEDQLYEQINFQQFKELLR
ncbi:P-loop containing nucleoside triphosphate hydrolase [Pseudocohnilembus persalinus]|uniref:p-loop containing nucleoside triphosphate hydrolase n=1 Tax=Pseudocohnilembus persalinus TaxID=266149 RepID=A0A0V0R5S9_PSEPJ|nr:P-loop containing nucleoside triphosphate hydrolase [Pseudocohnilembus persalinus]|eukprot:KRX09857.1 P-loop containing nucleoside triphosphate hydrolase [Pseudocohnilembus persalinus]